MIDVSGKINPYIKAEPGGIVERQIMHLDRFVGFLSVFGIRIGSYRRGERMSPLLDL